MALNRSMLHTMLLALGGWSGGAGTADEPPAGQIHYPAGSQPAFEGPEDYFTGEVRVDVVFPENDVANYSGAYVTFQPGARTNWHLHPAGQHMIVTSGIALTGTRDGRIIEFAEGEAVWCPPNIDHWHGSTPDEAMTHFVVTASRDGENVVWKEKVTDEQYSNGQERKAADGIYALSERHQAMVPIAAFAASGDLEALRTAIDAGLDAGLTINEVKEIQIHLYAYAGFPRTLNALATLMSVLDDRKARGIEDPPGEEAKSLPEGKSSGEFGREVQTELVGRPVSGPLFDFAPAANELLQRHLFGDLFARGILDYRDREVVTVAALASLEGVQSQLEAHVGIARNVGLSERELRDLASVLGENVGAAEARRARRAVEEGLTGHDDESSPDS